jgi:hypothetical protein
MAIEIRARGEFFLWRLVIVEKYGVRKRGMVLGGISRAIRGVFGGILEFDGGFSPTLSPSRLGMDCTFALGMTRGTKKWLWVRSDPGGSRRLGLAQVFQGVE